MTEVGAIFEHVCFVQICPVFAGPVTYSDACPSFLYAWLFWMLTVSYTNHCMAKLSPGTFVDSPINHESLATPLAITYS